MYDVLNIGFGSDCIERIEIIDKAVVYTEWHNTSELDLMLSLGLKDKNQQIIFNKDIIKYNFPDYENCSVGDYLMITHYGIVDLKINPYDNGFYVTNVIPGNYPDEPFYDQMGQNFVWDELEIIGNVYDTVLFNCSHCNSIDFINPPDMVSTCSVCSEQNLTYIDLSKHKKGLIHERTIRRFTRES